MTMNHDPAHEVPLKELLHKILKNMFFYHSSTRLHRHQHPKYAKEIVFDRFYAIQIIKSISDEIKILIDL